MTFQFKFQKVLQLKENEKEKSLTEYNLSVEEFEKAAEKLYECLKKKEKLEENTLTKLTTGMAVQEVRHFQQFVINLEKTIEHYQRLVILTRTQMNDKQVRLTQKNIEVKKYEKMKESHHRFYKQIEKRNDSKIMDELSIYSYLLHGN